ncbi:MAG: hypothetical protein AB7U73_00950 [Pirellulales bacterium]
MRQVLLAISLLLAGCGGPAAPSSAPITTAAEARAALQAAPHPDPQVELQRMTQAKAALDQERAAKLAEVEQVERAFEATRVTNELSGAAEPDAQRSAAEAGVEAKLETLRRHVTERLEPDLAKVDQRLAAAAARLKMQTEQPAP